MKRAIAVILLVLLLAGMASAMRLNIGTSQVHRLSIGASQGGGGGGAGVMEGSIFQSPIFGGKVLR